MGHYLSEMESDEEYLRRTEPMRRLRDLRTLGFDLPDAAPGIDVGFMGKQVLYVHKPCGLAVFLPDVHLPLCPAAPAPSKDRTC